MERRELLMVGIGAMAATAVKVDATSTMIAQSSQPAGATRVKQLGAHPLGQAFAEWQGTMIEVTYPPGASSAAHQHPGPTFGYVVSGRVKWAIDGGPAKILEAGQAFYEPMGSVHSTSANASATEPAVLSVLIISKPGEPLSKPVTGG
jgi:quercetin dioxygenase-like cupin family protein